MEKSKMKGMEQLVKVMLLASGSNIVAPKPVQEKIMEELFGDLLEKSSETMSGIAAVNKAVEATEDELKTIKAVCLSHLRPLQIIDLADFLNHKVVPAILDYVKDHEEAKEKVSADEALSALL